jgi:hypothetical protein
LSGARRIEGRPKQRQAATDALAKSTTRDRCGAGIDAATTMSKALSRGCETKNKMRFCESADASARDSRPRERARAHPDEICAKIFHGAKPPPNRQFGVAQTATRSLSRACTGTPTQTFMHG